MSPSEKARLFQDLAQLAKSGISFPKAAQTLAKHARGNSAKSLHAIGERLKAGDTIADSLRIPEAQFSPLEVGIVSAADSCGNLSAGLDHCAQYYESIATAQDSIRAKLRYPLFLLHFVAITSSIPSLFGDHGSISHALYSAFSQIALLWLGLGAFWGGVQIILWKAQTSLLLDSILRALPVLGTLRRDFAITRFCSAYNMQLNAGISVFLNLESSGRASASPVIQEASAKVAKVISEGGSTSDGLTATGIFPEAVVRAFCVGEETGDLNRELTLIASQYQQSALRRMGLMAEWLPKCLLILSYAYIGWGILSYYANYYRNISSMLKEM